jgi:multisubunit Na+/H+ antiporter MnhC subunit
VLFKRLLIITHSDYAVKVFGLNTFGTIYGTIVCISSLLTFTQSAMQELTHEAFHDNPIPVNLALAGFGLVIGVALVTFVAVAGKHVQHEVLEEEERRSQMPPDATPLHTPRLGPFLSPSLGPSYGTMRNGRLPSLRPSLANLRQLSAVDEETFKRNIAKDSHDDHSDWTQGHREDI